MEPLREVVLAPLMALRVEVGAVVAVTPRRRYVPIVGGSFTTVDGRAGSVLPGGADWQHQVDETTIEIAAHYALRTDAGEGIEVTSTGQRRITPELAARIAAGETVGPDEYYFRTFVRLATAVPVLSDLDGALGIATARRERDTVLLDVHEVR